MDYVLIYARHALFSHGGRILNFKINVEGDQFYIAPKKRFNSARALLDYYKTSPIRSKKYGNSKILLLNPIPVDKKQEDMFKLKLEQKGAQLEASTEHKIALQSKTSTFSIVGYGVIILPKYYGHHCGLSFYHTFVHPSPHSHKEAIENQPFPRPAAGALARTL